MIGRLEVDGGKDTHSSPPVRDRLPKSQPVATAMGLSHSSLRRATGSSGGKAADRLDIAPLAYADPYNGNAESDGAACLSFDEIFEGEPGDGLPRHNDGAREAAIRADGIAESMAESEREYQAASRAGFEFGELAEEIGATRRQTLSIIRKLKRLAKKISTTEAAESCAALRAVISRNVKKIRQTRKRHEELLNEFGQRPGFNDV